MKITVSEILEATGGRLLAGQKWRIITGVSTDSRTIKAGQLFVALKGERFDGHDFIDKAVADGAAAILAGEDVFCGNDVPVIKVQDTLQALKALAAYYRKLFHLTVVAVTGSTGKTTTKEFIYSVLSQKYSVLKNHGNLNNQIGLPLTIFNIDSRHQYAVLEMGMSEFGEIHDLADIARPHIGIITNIGVSHIEKLGSRENILKAKLELFDFFTADDLAVLNGDDLLLYGLHNSLPCRAIYFSTKGNGDVKALNIRLCDNGCYGYTVVLPDGKQEDIYLNLPGFHNIYNSLAAILVGIEAGVPLKYIKKGIESLIDTPQRLRVCHLPYGAQIIDDTYNANPDSMKAAIDVLSDVAKGRKIAVLGDMLELGAVAEQAHRELGRLLVEKNVDILITVGDMARFIADEAAIAGLSEDDIHSFSSRGQAISWLKDNLIAGDTVLVKGSHGMHMNEIVEHLSEDYKGVKNA